MTKKKNNRSKTAAKKNEPAKVESGSGSDQAGLGSESASEGIEEDDQVAQLRKENDEDLSAAASDVHGSGSDQAGLGSESASIGIEEDDDDDEDDSTLNVETNRDNPNVCIVIPFKEAAAKGNELRYALRAWDKHFSGCQILIVGDFPKWANPGMVGHIEHLSTSRNPQIDVAQKMLEVCHSELVPDYFIISNDDIYPVAPLTITDLDIHTAMGRLGHRGSAGSLYRQNAANTLQALKKAGIKAPWDFATHTPVGVWKDELSEVISRFAAHQVGHLVTTLYFNTVFPGHRPMLVDNGANPNNPGTQSYVGSVYRKVPPASVERAFRDRKFINNNDAGWSSVEPFLKKLFPNKSRFEK